MKKLKIAKTEKFVRFMHVAVSAEGEPLRVQAVSESGKLVTAKCNEAIYKRVLGERKGERGERFNLGLRKLTQVNFRAHYDDAGVIQALDIVPARSFVSGAAPRVAGDAIKKGFDIHFDEDLNGYDIWSEDPRSGDKVRATYAGLSDRGLENILDSLRKANWGSKNSITIDNHRFEKVEEGVFRCRPLGEVKYTT